MISIDIKRFKQLEKDGWLRSQKHPKFPLLIWNYTPETQFSNHWTPETLMARGLITTDKGEIVARPFPKFFNLEEHGSPKLPKIPEYEKFEVFEKLDGSLGIVYFWEDKFYIATRGSFESEQAKEAQKMLDEKFPDGFYSDMTYLFEIIYPENRIVVNYGDTRDIILLDVIETETGKSLLTQDMRRQLQDLGYSIVQSYPDVDNFRAIPNKYKDNNKEGYVIRFESGFRLKIKFEEYKRLHKIMTEISSYNIWELMKAKQSLRPVLERVPDEMFDWIKKTQSELNKNFEEIKTHIVEIAKESDKQLFTVPEEYRLSILEKTELARINKAYNKMVAEFILKNSPEHKEIVFAYKNKANWEGLIWDKIKPKYERPFEIGLINNSDEEN